MTNEQRIQSFAKLGTWLENPGNELDQAILRSQQENAWFSAEEVNRSLKAIAFMLNESDLKTWFASDIVERDRAPAQIGLVLAGNVPMVGFHDVLCVLATGNHAIIKLSSQDKQLLPPVLEKLTQIEPLFKGSFQFVDRLTGFDAVIATGSGNTSRYFDYYFNKVPHVIRKNRSSVAVLSGDEKPGELEKLGHDIFDYFGLGCRNVSKVFLPRGYDAGTLFKAIEPFNGVLDQHKYSNNYDYNKSILLVNGDQHLDNGFLLLKPDEGIASPLAVLYSSEYDDLDSLSASLRTIKDQLQCVVSERPITGIQTVSPGQSQKPRLWDYADDVNTPQFLFTV